MMLVADAAPDDETAMLWNRYYLMRRAGMTWAETAAVSEYDRLVLMGLLEGINLVGRSNPEMFKSLQRMGLA